LPRRWASVASARRRADLTRRFFPDITAAPHGAAVFSWPAGSGRVEAVELVERLLQGDVTVEVGTPVACRAAQPLALDQALEPQPQRRPRLAGHRQRGSDLDAGRQEEGGADGGVPGLEHLPLAVFLRVFCKCRHGGLRCVNGSAHDRVGPRGWGKIP
jgi:hypothetical protein